MKSETATRFVRLRPMTQAVVLGVATLLFAWSVIATSLLFIDGISSGSDQQQARLSRTAFEARLDSLARERDARAAEAMTAQSRFQTALEQVSQMQSALLASEERRRELETGIEVIQSTLRRTIHERDAAREQVAAADTAGDGEGPGISARAEDMEHTVDLLALALGETAAERDTAVRDAEVARQQADEIALEKRLLEERNDEIFTTLEGAVKVSMAPLDKVFREAGMNPDQVLSQIRRGYSGTGGPLIPVALSSKSMADLTADEARARDILTRLDEMNMYRIAVDRLPLAMPLRDGFRFTSPFGYRWGRLHAGVDFAAPVGTRIYAPADGVVIATEWQRGYGNLIRIRHEFGIETRYGHLSKFRVKVGQKVSQGDLIADMGNTGRSTGPHLHYEIRVGGKPINPMTFIKAGKNVF